MDEKEEKSIKAEITEIKKAVTWLSKTSADRIHKIEDKIQKQNKKVSDRVSKHIEVVESERHKQMKQVKYIGVEFDPVSVKKGEAEVNAALKAGFEPIRDFETAKGIVMVLGMWGNRDVQTRTRTERRL